MPAPERGRCELPVYADQSIHASELAVASWEQDRVDEASTIVVDGFAQFEMLTKGEDLVSERRAWFKDCATADYKKFYPGHQRKVTELECPQFEGAACFGMQAEEFSENPVDRPKLDVFFAASYRGGRRAGGAVVRRHHGERGGAARRFCRRCGAWLVVNHVAESA